MPPTKVITASKSYTRIILFISSKRSVVLFMHLRGSISNGDWYLDILHIIFGFFIIRFVIKFHKYVDPSSAIPKKNFYFVSTPDLQQGPNKKYPPPPPEYTNLLFIISAKEAKINIYCMHMVLT